MVYCEFEYRLDYNGNWNRTRQRLAECSTFAAEIWVEEHYGSSARHVEIRNLKKL